MPWSFFYGGEWVDASDARKLGYFVLILGGACYRIKGFALRVSHARSVIAYYLPIYLARFYERLFCWNFSLRDDRRSWFSTELYEPRSRRV